MPSAGSKSTSRTVAPRSAAASAHGVTLASWSRRVTTTSSPGPQVRASARLTAKVRLVMFWPKTTSSGRPPRKSAIASRAAATTASASRLAPKAPPMLEVPTRRRPAIASITPAGTWVPPGPSR